MTESVIGSQEPSVRIAPQYNASDGYDASRIISIGGRILDPWQNDVLDDWMARAPSGRWACPTCGGSVPRQNGKTGLVSGRSEAGMIMYNEQVLYTAHLQKTATETFEEIAAFFDCKALKKYLQDIKTALGREQIILKSGARIKFLARTRNGGRGQHGDLLIFDEAQELTADQQASFFPQFPRVSIRKQFMSVLRRHRNPTARSSAESETAPLQARQVKQRGSSFLFLRLAT